MVVVVVVVAAIEQACRWDDHRPHPLLLTTALSSSGLLRWPTHMLEMSVSIICATCWAMMGRASCSSLHGAGGAGCTHSRTARAP